MLWANDRPQLYSLGIRCTDLTASTGVFLVDQVDAFPTGLNAAVNGGIAAALADQAMGVMAIRGAPAGQVSVTGVLHVQFHRPAFAPLTMRATLLPGGHRVQFVEVLIEGSDGRRCVTAHGTMVNSVLRESGSSSPSMPEATP